MASRRRCLPFRHAWRTIDTIGAVKTQRCDRCGMTRVRVGR